jgi:threonine/homoserine/homoserine lactone efflux protein
MTPDQLAAFALFSAVAAGTPGPSNTLLTATGAAVGVRRGLPALLGVALGMGTMMFVVAFGLGSAILASPAILTVLKWCGTAYLLWLAWKIATAGAADGAATAQPVGFVGAAAFQVVNPKSWLVCASAAATFLDPSAGSALVQSATLAVTFVLAALPSCLPWLAAGALLQRFLRAERSRRAFNLAMGVLLAASAVVTNL